MEFSGKVALITGAGSGLGEAMAQRLAAEGATIGVLDLRPDRVDSVSTAIAVAGGRAVPLVADVSDEADMRAAVERLVAETGRIDIVVANAGINGVWAAIDDLTPAEFDRTVAINLRGTYLTLHFSVPHLKAAGSGAIVVISSINGTRSFSGAGGTVYSATKAGQMAMANHLALELGRHKIRVNTVCPGGTVTNIRENTIYRNVGVGVPVSFPEGDIPISGGKPAIAADVADAVRFLVSDESRHINGTVLYVDGGQSLLR